MKERKQESQMALCAREKIKQEKGVVRTPQDRMGNVALLNRVVFRRPPWKGHI